MSPLLRASLPRFHVLFASLHPLDRTVVLPNLPTSSWGGCSRRCSVLSYPGRFPTVFPYPTPGRGLPGGSSLGFSAEVARFNAVCCDGFASVTAGGGGGFLCLFLAWYLNTLNKYPVSMKSTTSAFLTLIGDLICQCLIDHVKELDLKRTFVFSFLGLVLVGPTLHFWYLYLSKLVTLQGASGAFLRLLLDQFIFSPIFIGVFLSALITLEGRPNELVPKLKQEWFSSVVANWKLWIPFQFLNFWFVPQHCQVLVANFVALVWNVVLSFKAHREIKQEAALE